MTLIDSNVLIASLVETHEHSEASRQFLAATAPYEFVIASHSCCEAYNHLTRSNGPFRISPALAQQQITSLIQTIRTVSLSVSQTMETIRRFATLGGVGPRLYDYLIGATGEAFGADTIVTWNVRHFVPLFPHLRIVTPAELTAPIS